MEAPLLLSPRQLAEPAFDSCRAALREVGSCRNLAQFTRGDRSLLGVLFRYPRTQRERVDELFGKLGRVIGADTMVLVADAWRVIADEDEEPRRVESLAALIVSADETHRFRQDYSRDEAQQVVEFGDVEDGEATIGATAVEPFRRGLRLRPGAPEPDIRAITANLERLLGRFPLYPLDPRVAAVLSRIAQP